MPETAMHEEVGEQLPWVERENFAANWIEGEVLQKKYRQRDAANFETRKDKMLENKNGNIRYQQVFYYRRKK